MRRLTVIAVLALGLAACGGSASDTPLGSGKATTTSTLDTSRVAVPSSSPALGSTVDITLGVRGGNLAPYSVSIEQNGTVTTRGSLPPHPLWQLTSAEDARVSSLVRRDLPGLKSERCARTLPDVSEMYITALGKTVTVRGTCEPGFETLWAALIKALGLQDG